MLALTSLPYLWGAIIDFEGRVFSGFVYTFTYYDIMSYLAKMRDGFEGAWVYTNPFTTGEVKPVFLFMFYIALGHLARLMGLSLVLAYHVARVGCGVFLLAAVDRMIRRLGWSGPVRLLAFALVFLGGGFGWLLRWTGIEGVPVEFSQTEGFAFQSMLSYPHFVLTLGLMVWMLTDAWRFARGEAGGSAMAGGVVGAFILAWVHPRPVLTIVLVSAVAAGWGSVRGLWSMRRWAVWIAGVMLAAAGPMIISLLTVRTDPLWTEWSRTETLSSAPWRYLGAYGLLWPLAVAGLVRAGRKNEPWAPLLGGWVLVASLLPFLPIAAQVRLIIGWNIPLALLSGYALGDLIVPRLKAAAAPVARATPVLIGLLMLLMSLSAFAYLGTGVRRVLIGSFPGYFSGERVAAMDWLATNTNPDDAVLSAFLSGMFIPGYAGNRVVQGHWAETFHLDQKTEEIERIFDADTPADVRRQLLEELKVGYLFYGQWERDLGDYDPALHPEVWAPRWKGAVTTIYEFER